MKLNEQRKVFKINSGFLKKSRWNLTMPLETALKQYPDFVVSLNESQLLRWLDELNGIEDSSARMAEIKVQIKKEKSKKKTSKVRAKIKDLYEELNNLKFQKDYIAVIMDSEKDYDRANQGFKVNGITYRRLFGTSNGVKKKTIVYINAALYDEIKKRIDNGRNQNIPLVPGKLEAYQSLTASGSTPIPFPNGIIVVNDCITHFKEDVIKISDETEGEPLLTYEDDFEIEHNDSDGFGLMLPSYAKRVNQYLTGNDGTISGMNTRFAFEKGMLFTFPFDEFAEKIAGTYKIKDVWGTVRDIRDAEVILTESMLKLWACYENWEDYYAHCMANHYQFATPKICPDTLESVRDLNYQFINPYNFTDEDLQELCKPTIDTINDILGGDYRKALVYLSGVNLNETNIDKINDDWIKAIMVNPAVINDDYIKRSIYHNLAKKIDDAKKGTITVNGSYLIISGDPFALAQSIFGLEVTGILKAGEIYQRYWLDKGAKELVCYRAPMTCYNNIRKMTLNQSAEAAHWYRYITTALIFNAWDSACDAMNGADKDGDTNLITDNPVLLRNTENAKTIFCLQKKAEKKIVTESDLIACNKIAFNDDIGAITNRATAMYDIKSQYPADSEEYKILDYRIMCTQHYQQCSIDRIKGVISPDMPSYWYKVSKDMGDVNRAIVARCKPYFMTYRYPELRQQFKKHFEGCNSNALRKFKTDLNVLIAKSNPTEDEQAFIDGFKAKLPVSMFNCVSNRICWIFEDEYKNTIRAERNTDFDYNIYKSGIEYSKQMYNKIKTIYEEYAERIKEFAILSKAVALDKDDVLIQKQALKDYFIEECDKVCFDDAVLCDILIDLCYRDGKNQAFAWDICGTQIIKNLGNSLYYPCLTDDAAGADFEFMGNYFIMTNGRNE